MKTFVISRKQDAARRAALVERLSALGIAFELVEGVDGFALGDAEKRRLADFPKMRRVLRVLGDGEIGCAVSHQNVYRRMIAENVPVACVLEDDARILSSSGEAWENGLSAGVAEDKPAVKLLTDRAIGATWAIGYVLNRAGAETMLRFNSPVFMVADCWESVRRRGLLSVVWDDVPRVGASGLPSVITPAGTPPHRVPLPMDFPSRLRRAFWRLRYGLGFRI